MDDYELVLQRQVHGALKAALHRHGEITEQNAGTVAQSVVSSLALHLRDYARKDANARNRLARVKALERRDGPGCFYCLAVLPWQDYTFDHYVPRCRGGTRELSNLRLACATCNNRKGSLTAERFRTEQAERSRERPLPPPDELEPRRERRHHLTAPISEARGADLLSGYAPPGPPEARAEWFRYAGVDAMGEHQA